MSPGADSRYAAGQNQNPSMSNRGNIRGSSGPNSRPASRQPSMTGNSQYPAPQYRVQDSHYNQAPQPVEGPDRNQQHHPSNQGYATSDPADQSQGPAYGQQGLQPSKANPAIQLGAYPAGMAAANPVYGMPNPAGYGQQQQHNAAYPNVTYGGPQQGQGYEQQGPLGQGAQQPHSHVQYPAVLYDQQHQNYADHDPHTMVLSQHCNSRLIHCTCTYLLYKHWLYVRYILHHGPCFLRKVAVLFAPGCARPPKSTSHDSLLIILVTVQLSHTPSAALALLTTFTHHTLLMLVTTTSCHQQLFR